MEVSNTF